MQFAWVLALQVPQMVHSVLRVTCLPISHEDKYVLIGLYVFSGQRCGLVEWSIEVRAPISGDNVETDILGRHTFLVDHCSLVESDDGDLANAIRIILNNLVEGGGDTDFEVAPTLALHRTRLVHSKDIVDWRLFLLHSFLLLQLLLQLLLI